MMVKSEKSDAEMKDYLRSPEWCAYLQLREERPEAFLPSSQLPIETDEKIVQQYVEETGKKIGVLYQSAYSLLVVDLIQDARGGYFTYERILPAVTTGAVVAAAICEGKFVLLKQYRHALRAYQYAFVRGFGEPGISPAENVKQEIKEETGADILNVQYLGNVVADSGLCGNKADVYLCEVQNIDCQYHYEGIEDLVLLTEDELKVWIQEGKINDGFTLAAYSLYINRKRVY